MLDMTSWHLLVWHLWLRFTFSCFFFILHSAFWLLRQCHPTSAVNQTFVRCWDVKSYSVDALCQNGEPCWTIKPLLDMWIPEVTLSEREYFENSTCWDLINPCGIFVACKMIKPPTPQAQSTNHTKPALLQPWNSPKPSVHGLTNRYKNSLELVAEDLLVPAFSKWCKIRKAHVHFFGGVEEQNHWTSFVVKPLSKRTLKASCLSLNVLLTWQQRLFTSTLTRPGSHAVLQSFVEHSICMHLLSFAGVIVLHRNMICNYTYDNAIIWYDAVNLRSYTIFYVISISVSSPVFSISWGVLLSPPGLCLWPARWQHVRRWPKRRDTQDFRRCSCRQRCLQADRDVEMSVAMQQLGLGDNKEKEMLLEDPLWEEHKMEIYSWYSRYYTCSCWAWSGSDSEQELRYMHIEAARSHVETKAGIDIMCMCILCFWCFVARVSHRVTNCFPCNYIQLITPWKPIPNI